MVPWLNACTCDCVIAVLVAMFVVMVVLRGCVGAVAGCTGVRACVLLCVRERWCALRVAEGPRPISQMSNLTFVL